MTRMTETAQKTRRKTSERCDVGVNWPLALELKMLRRLGHT